MSITDTNAPAPVTEQYDLLKLASCGDKAAIDTLVEDNIGLVWSVVRKFGGRGHETDDLFQLGCMGLLKAIKRFDTSYNVRFSTYAVPMIMGEIKRFLRDDGPIKVSRSTKELAIRARAVSDLMHKQNGEAPSVAALAGELGVESEDVVFALEASSPPESLYAGEDAEGVSPLMARLQSGEPGEGEIVDRIALAQALRTLPPRERQIVVFRYFQGKTQSQIADVLGISQVQVSRLEKKVLAAMRGMLEG